MSENTPKYGIVIAAYNAEQTLQRAVDSVRKQTVDDWQLIIVDDGSIDSTYQIASQFAQIDERIIVVSQRNQGSATARNNGIERLETEWISYLDADDELDPRYLNYLQSFIAKHSAFDVYAVGLIRLDPDGWEEAIWKNSRPVVLSIEKVLSGFSVSLGAALMRKAFFVQQGGFRTEIRYGEDYDFILRALADGASIVRVPKNLLRYDCSIIGRKSDQEEKRAAANLEIISDLETRDGLTASQKEVIDRALTIGTARLERASLSPDARESSPSTEHEIMKQEVISLRASLLKIFPIPIVKAILYILHKVAWLVRPVRRRNAQRKLNAMGE